MKIFRESYQNKEKCSFGREHNVTYNEVKEVTEVGRESIDQFYGDAYVGKVPQIWYADSDGVIYHREATWDGTSSFLTGDDGSEFWCVRPHGTWDVAKDLESNVLDVWGEPID